jgi:hypothetical protein
MKLNVAVAVFFVFSILCYSEAKGENWMYFSTSNNADHYYDKASLQSLSAKTVKVSEKAVYTEDGKNWYIDKLLKMGNSKKSLKRQGYYSLKENISSWEMDCEQKTRHLLRTTYYNEKGVIIYDRSYQPGEYKSPIIAGSVMENLYKIVCK